MAAGTKSFLFNKQSDWLENGLIKNLKFIDDKIVLKSDNGENGYYISTSLDSMEAETVWDRTRLKTNIKGESIIRVSFYASDSLYVNIPLNAKENVEVNLDEYIKDESIPINKRLNILKTISTTKDFDNSDDVLLYSLTGRYMWFSIEVVNYTFNDINIDSIKIEFPRKSFVSYLPEIYQNDSNDAFLSRFIGIFESIYLDIEEKIDNMPRMFDPMIVDREFLNWMTRWFSLKDSYIWSEDKLRLIVKNAVKLYKVKGTPNAIRYIVWMYTSYNPKLIEQFEIIESDFYNNNKEMLNRLFGENGYTFTVIVNSNTVKDSDEYVALLKLINLFKPADVKCNLVVLSDTIYLDCHCYLGVNSYIAHNKQMVLGESDIIVDSTFLTD